MMRRISEYIREIMFFLFCIPYAIKEIILSIFCVIPQVFILISFLSRHLVRKSILFSDRHRSGKCQEMERTLRQAILKLRRGIFELDKHLQTYPTGYRRHMTD